MLRQLELLKKVVSVIIMIVGSSCMMAQSNNSIINNVDADQLYQLLEDSTGVIVDVRTLDEFNSGHIKGARMVDYFSDDFAKDISKLPKDRALFVYCRSGNRSYKACEILAKNGYNRIYNLEGGYKVWCRRK